jgi:hypothetical protein
VTFSQRSRGQVIQHGDVNQYGQYLVGTKAEAASRYASTAGSYADSLRQEDTTNGQVFRAGYGTSGAPTWVIDATKSAVKVKNLVMADGLVFDIRYFGAVANDSSTSAMNANVQAIQQAVDAATAVKGSAFIPPGNWYINAPIKMHNRQGCAIIGVTPQASTVIYVGAAEEPCILDMTGSQYCLLANWQIQVSLSSASVTCGLLLVGGYDGSTNGTASTANSFYRWHCSTPGGTEAALRCPAGLVYAFAAGDAVWVHCNLNQSGSNRPTINCINDVAQGYTDGVFTRTGSPGAYNYFSAESGAQTLPTSLGKTGCSDWTLVACELHNTGGGKATIRLGSASGFRFLGGPISNAASGYVELFGTSGAADPSLILFYGCTMYREGGNAVAPNAFEISSDITVTGLDVVACNLQCTGSVFGDSSGLARPIFDGLFYRGVSSVGAGGHTSVINFGGSSATSRIKNSDIWCEGKNVTIGGTIDASTTLHNPGTVTTTGGSNNAFYARTGTTANEAMAGNKVGRQWVTMSPGAATSAGTTYYGWDGSVSASDQNYAVFPAPFAGTVKNLYLASSGAPGSGQTYTATLYKNGSSTALTAAISGGSATTANNTANSVTFNAGDTLQLRLVTSGSAGANDVAVSAEVQAAPTT